MPHSVYVKVMAMLAISATTSLVNALPCDIYASGGTPCVAAHSTTRALYASYNGPLYQVKRSNGQTLDIHPLQAGGVANAGAQDTFCANTNCIITIIYDQSGHNNQLNGGAKGHFAGPGPNGADNYANAAAAPVTVGGHKAYGLYNAAGTGYRNNAATGTAKGDAAEGIYAVLDGTHYSGACCFDYGNAEVSGTDTGAGHMEAIYFGNWKAQGTGSGPGPWIMMDMENGVFTGRSAKNNPANPTVDYRFLTAVVKGEANHWAIRGGNAASGGLSSFYDGVRPNGYNPMKKEGAIILGVGGDNSNGGAGTFYEGAMTSGYPTDATENLVQADIVAAKYVV